MTALLEARGLTARFGGVTALDGFDLSVAAGERRCLIGPNGAGKSTFLKCVAGRLRPRAGRVRLAGRDVTRWPACARAAAGLGVKTQVPSLFESLTAAEHCRLAARGPVDAELLARLGLDPGDPRPASALSHGERQMTELAAVLSARPRVVLLDEPAAGLSPGESDRVAAVLRGLAGRTAVVVVEHDMRFVAALDCPVTALHRGRVLAEGARAETLADPAVRAAYFGAPPGAPPGGAA